MSTKRKGSETKRPKKKRAVARKSRSRKSPGTKRKSKTKTTINLEDEDETETIEVDTEAGEAVTTPHTTSDTSGTTTSTPTTDHVSTTLSSTALTQTTANSSELCTSADTLNTTSPHSHISPEISSGKIVDNSSPSTTGSSATMSDVLSDSINVISAEPEFPISQLPLDVFVLLLSQLPLDHIETFDYVCSYWHKTLRQPYLWDALLRYIGFESLFEWSIMENRYRFFLCLISRPHTDLTPFSQRISHFLIQRGYKATFFRLIKNPSYDLAGNSLIAICVAASHGAHDVVSYLLKDSRVNIADCAKNKVVIGAPIISAFPGGTQPKLIPTAANKLTDQSQPPNASPSLGDIALQQATYWGCTDVVRVLLRDLRVDPSADNSAALRWAATRGHSSIVRILLKDGRSDPSAVQSEGLRHAALRGHTEVVRLFLEDGRADPLAESESAMRVAIDGGHIEVVNLLIRDKFSRCTKSLK